MIMMLREYELIKMKVLILHVPHTSGRSLRRYLWTNRLLGDDLKLVHNGKQIEPIVGIDWDIVYFILRDPILRLYKQYHHYSRNLQQIGRVNHLDMSEIIKTNPNYDLNSFEDFFQLEQNRNLYCKFLLLRTDFTEPITTTDWNKIQEEIKTEKYRCDMFGSELRTLSQILDRDIDRTNIVYAPYSCPEITKNQRYLIELNNQFDMLLFKMLSEDRN